MPRYTISESVGSRVLPVHSFEDLHKHHPSSGRESGRDYGTVNGEFEEIRSVQGHTFIKKDFILASDAPGPVEVPAPASGYAHFLHDAWNTVQIYDKPFGTPGAERQAQVLHMVNGSSGFGEGAKVAYGQPLGEMGQTGSPGSIHVHVEAELGQFQQYVRDMDQGVIRPGMTPAAGSGHAAPSEGSNRLLLAGDQGTEVHAMQSRLHQLGYRNADGTPLGVDGHFGNNTLHAVKAFQQDHHLTVDGKAGDQTRNAVLQSELNQLGYKDAKGNALAVDGNVGAHTRVALQAFQHEHKLTASGQLDAKTQTAIDQALAAPAKQAVLPLTDAKSPDHALYQQALAGVQKIDAQMGRPSDDHSIRLAAALVSAAKTQGITRIDAVALSEDGARTFAVQNTKPTQTVAQLDTATAVATSVEKSSAAAHAAQAPDASAHPLVPPNQPGAPLPPHASPPAPAGATMMA